MSAGRAPRTHDLLRLRTPQVLTADSPLPAWVEPALRRAPWVVVRRGPIDGHRIAIGVRGAERSQRFAAMVLLTAIVEQVSPEQLSDSLRLLGDDRRLTLPALLALARVAPILANGGHCWGPGGSVGFELATGVPATTAASDLDMILRRNERLEPNEAGALLAALVDAAAPARIDVLLETPSGGVLLSELAANPTRVLVRTREGARLCSDPWAADVP